ncbi:alpha/beta hydrolase [Prauserella oleivorans]|uniref:Alpha/beta hydrolase n=1 Tax=Prauserella oleivorans TaxID=1478153 RepID=A0ABW5WD32_9PSEU
MTIVEHRPAGRTWTPDGVRRGTVVVLPGRGERIGRYRRLATRLAAEGYRVEVTAPGEPVVRAEHPWFLLGADTGAHVALEAAQRMPVSALVLAGLPGDPEWRPARPVGRDEEIAWRVADPDRQAALRVSDDVRHGELLRSPPRPMIGVPTVSTLVLHGEADVLSPSLRVRQRVASWPRVRLVSVADSGHDVLHDAHHRSVAAEILLFLERFRSGGAPVLRTSLRSTI